MKETGAMRLVELRAGSLQASVAPAVGGSIARFEHLGAAGLAPIFRSAPADYQDVLEAACFPLVPFANRVRGGAFRFRNRIIRLSPNMKGDPSPIHGQGWRSAWRIVRASADTVELAFQHPAGEWPWAYEALNRISLDPGGLELQLSCRNLSKEPMPCGLGFHPYFPCSDRTVLDTDVSAVWTVDAQVLPVAREPATGRYDLHRRAICGQGLDNGFDGWCGRAEIDWPERSMKLAIVSPDAPRFQVFSPPAGGLFVAEPVTNANAALNQPEAEWPSLGLTMLAPGAASSLKVRFDLSVGATSIDAG